jgi:Reverse transcriptase (RNA-dependent DNA polymerase)
MAKTFRNLWPEVVDFENLWRAYQKARRHKRYKEPAAWFAMNVEHNLLTLQRELRDGSYRPGGVHQFRIWEPKERVISAAPFRDRVVHHAVVNVLEPLYERRFSPYSYACRKGKGTHAAMEQAHWGVRNCRYFLKGDIEKFYPSVDHAVLKGVLFRKVGDARLRDLLGLIIDGGPGSPAERPGPRWFAGDDLLTPVERQRGMPIGNLTSQFFANVLLNELDQFVHEQIRPRLYVRYMDDFLLFDHGLPKLQQARTQLVECAAGLRLRLHERKTQVRACRQGVKFVGYKLTPVTRRVCPENIGRFRARMGRWRRRRRENRVAVERITASVRGWLAHLAHANAAAMTREVLADVRV